MNTRIIFSLFIVTGIFLFSNRAFSAHIIGGEIYYDCLGNGSYGVTIKLYKECGSEAPYDSPLTLGIFNNTNNSLVRTESISYPGSDVLPVVFNNPCVNPPSSICIEEAVYRKIINLPPSADGYTLSYQRCCREPSILNVANPGEEGLTLSTTIPGTNSGIECNSSARFTNFPPLVLCNNQELVFDHSAEEDDGDVIEYSLCTPFHGASTIDPMPNPPDAPNYSEIVWENGYSETTPFGNTGPINIDPNTGLLTASPQMLGPFVVGICAREYRNGQLISETRRDFVFTVFDCEVTLEADILAQEEMATFESYCQGLTIDFENESYGGTNYFWDFGVDDDPSATSTAFEPSFTYPEPGTYEVTLVVNPNWPCTDTATQTFEINESITIEFAPPDSQCIVNNSFDFTAFGNYNEDADVWWDFGEHASVTIDSNEVVTNVVFDTSGQIPVTVYVTDGDCEGSYTDSVFIFREPEIDFGIKPGLYCAPFTAQFVDSSLSDAPLTYFWDFGDGNTSTLMNPTHIYDTPGSYDVSLKITSQEGCIVDLFLEKPGLIVVHPSPVANFEVSPQQTDAFNTEITFTDLSQDSEEHYYFFTETDSTEERNTTWFYNDGGLHYPMQLVINEHGCRDSTERVIYVQPQTTFYIPNSFTPNDDDLNEVFKPEALDVDYYEFIILNRWGKEVFSTNNPNEGWDGTKNGIVQSNDVYVWIVRFRSHTQIFEEHIGHVTLVR